MYISEHTAELLQLLDRLDKLLTMLVNKLREPPTLSNSCPFYQYQLGYDNTKVKDDHSVYVIHDL